MIFRGHTLEGRLVLPPEAESFLRRYHDEPVIVEVTTVWSRRSLPQNARHWAGLNRAVKLAASQLPYTVAEIHDAMKARSEVIQPARLYFPNGEWLGDAKLSRTLPVPKFSEFLEEVSATFARGGIDIFPEEHME